MAFANFVVSFLFTLSFVMVSFIVLKIIFKKNKEMIHVVYSLVLFIMVNYFAFSQKAHIFEHFPGSAKYALYTMLFAMYLITFYNCYSYITVKKLANEK